MATCKITCESFNKLIYIEIGEQIKHILQKKIEMNRFIATISKIDWPEELIMDFKIEISTYCLQHENMKHN
jgi:hypothetical protein